MNDVSSELLLPTAKEVDARRPSIHILSDGEIDYLGRQVGRDPQEVKKLVKRGTDGLASYDSLTIDSWSSKRDEQSMPSSITQPELNAFAIDISGLEGMVGLYFNNGGIMDSREDGSVSVYFQNTHEESAGTYALHQHHGSVDIQPNASRPRGKKFLVGFDVDEYLRTNALSFYSVRGEDGEVTGIIPIWNEHVDVDITDETEEYNTGCRFFLRRGEGPISETERLELTASAKLFAEEVLYLKGRLNLPEGWLEDVGFIFDNYQTMMRTYATTFQSTGGERLVVRTAGKILTLFEGENKGNNIRRRARHELLHHIDRLLSTGGKNFSDEVGIQFIKLIRDQALEYGIDDEKLHLGEVKVEDDGRSLVKPSNNPLSSLFNESKFFDDSFGGHPGDSVTELFASCLNVALDPTMPEPLGGGMSERSKRTIPYYFPESETSKLDPFSRWEQYHQVIYGELERLVKARIAEFAVEAKAA